jgi:hypothetical protein
MALVLDGSGDITGLTAGALPSTVIGSGAVLQIATGKSTGTVLVNSSTITSLGVSATITPISSSSKILVWAFVHHASASDKCEVHLYRNGSGINDIAYLMFDKVSGDATFNPQTISAFFVDSPSTTSALTYALYGKDHSDGTIYFNGRGYNGGDHKGGSKILLMEVA